MTECRKSPDDTTLIFGYDVPNRLVDRAGPFFLGMLTTYVLQILMPVVFHYTLVTARVLKIVFIWLAVTAIICWYTGILNPQLLDMQLSVADIFARFTEKGPLTKNHSSAPKTTRDAKILELSRRDKSETQRPLKLEASKSPGSLSPVRKSDSTNLPYIPAFVSKEDTKALVEPEHAKEYVKESSPTINVRPFLAQRRDGVQSSHFDPKSMPNSPGPSFQTMHSRDMGQGRKGLSRANSESTLKTNRKAAASSRKPAAASPHDDFPSLTLLETRRNSVDTFSTGGTNKSHKPLPPISQTASGGLAHGYKEVQRSRNSSFADEEEMHSLKREDSVMSKQSVLGTRKNYSKFLANVGR